MHIHVFSFIFKQSRCETCFITKKKYVKWKVKLTFFWLTKMMMGGSIPEFNILISLFLLSFSFIMYTTYTWTILVFCVQNQHTCTMLVLCALYNLLHNLVHHMLVLYIHDLCKWNVHVYRFHHTDIFKDISVYCKTNLGEYRLTTSFIGRGSKLTRNFNIRTQKQKQNLQKPHEKIFLNKILVST